MLFMDIILIDVCKKNKTLKIKKIIKKETIYKMAGEHLELDIRTIFQLINCLDLFVLRK
jgi:hypothetical protein